MRVVCIARRGYSAGIDRQQQALIRSSMSAALMNESIEMSDRACLLAQYHSAAVAALAFDKETKLLAAGSRDGTVSIWSVYT